MKRNRIFGTVLFFILTLTCYSQTTVRIKDITSVGGVRENQLIGLGIVTGLDGKGDSAQSALMRFTLSNLISSFGVTLSAEEIRSKNSAVVMVTADITPFARSGDRLTVHVSSVGDAASLTGGMLLQTHLKAANNQVYAVAQGPVAGSSANNGIKTVATVPHGAIVEQTVLSEFRDQDRISLIIKQPDFTTASLVSSRIKEEFPDIAVNAVDASLISIEIPDEFIQSPVDFIASIESLSVRLSGAARVVINPRSGVVVLGQHVKIGNVAVSYRGDRISIGSPFGDEDRKEQFLIEEDTTVSDLVTILQEVGIKTDSIIEILKAIDQAGALFGELIVM